MNQHCPNSTTLINQVFLTVPLYYEEHKEQQTVEELYACVCVHIYVCVCIYIYVYICV